MGINGRRRVQRGVLLVTTLAAALALLQPREASAEPLRPWTWAKIPYFVHCANDTGPLNDAMVDTMAAASFTVVEKWQCLYCSPNETGAEQKMVAAAAQIRERNPVAPVFLYWQADWARWWYSSGVWFDQHPELELHNANGSLFVDTAGGASGGAWHAYDFANNASVTAWADHIAETYRDGSFDGVLIDGVNPRCPDPDADPEVAAAFEAGKAASGLVLKAALPPAAHQLANTAAAPPGYSGTMTEFFQGTNQSMNKLRALKGSFVEVHATSRGGNFNLSLAAYLVCAEEGMYFGAANLVARGKGGWSDCAGWSEPQILEQYAKPLGPPTGPGVWSDATGSWTRAFATGTRVEIRPGTIILITETSLLLFFLPSYEKRSICQDRLATCKREGNAFRT
jgi:hypothetical protein